MIIKSARNIANNFDFIARSGVEALRQGMKKAKKFDPDNPDCSKKNDYFNEANNYCMVSLWQLKLYDLCERYYAILLEEIRTYEDKKTTNFNKGMVYANLGVTKIVQGKIDEGFANILKALIEDEPCHKKDSSVLVFKNPLFKQFEDGTGEQK